MIRGDFEMPQLVGFDETNRGYRNARLIFPKNFNKDPLDFENYLIFSGEVRDLELYKEFQLAQRIINKNSGKEFIHNEYTKILGEALKIPELKGREFFRVLCCYGSKAPLEIIEEKLTGIGSHSGDLRTGFSRHRIPDNMMPPEQVRIFPLVHLFRSLPGEIREY